MAGARLNFRAGTEIGGGSEAVSQSVRELLMRAVLVNLLSPGPIIFWATVNGPLLVQGLRKSLLHGVAFLVAFYGTFLAILVGFVIVFNKIGTLDPRITRALLLLITVLLVVFGLSLIGQGLGLI